MIRFVDEFRSKKAALYLAGEIRSIMPGGNVSYMEICGGHTLTAVRYGLHGLLPENLHLKSGPGCPVCVTSQDYIDAAVALSGREDTVIASFGDMLKVPGATGTLLEARSAGRDVRVCLSPLEAVEMAARSPDKEVIFLGIGFETTAPAVAMAILTARERSLENFSVLTALKTMPAAMAALVDGQAIGLNGFICPGHVTAVAGARMYERFVSSYRLPCVISGFEPTDMLGSVLMLLRQTVEGRAEIEIEYTRAVTTAGNNVAQQAVAEVFQPVDASWRGLGVIPGSGLACAGPYAAFDAGKKFPISLPASADPPGCRCGDVMRGLLDPPSCPLFGRGCTPERPIGACMVSAEGACGIHFRYGSAASAPDRGNETL